MSVIRKKIGYIKTTMKITMKTTVNIEYIKTDGIRF